MNNDTEMVVVGAGPAGISAAIAAAENGVSVTLVDVYPRPGGQYYKQLPDLFSADDQTQHHVHAQELIGQLENNNLEILSDTLVWGVFPEPQGGWLLTLQSPESSQKIKTKNLVLAPGAYDRPLAFPGWTLPGVVTAGAVQTMIKSQRVLPGKKFILSGSGPLQLAVAAQLIHAGAEVTAVLEGAPGLIKGGLKHCSTILAHPGKVIEGFGYWRTLQRAGVPLQLRKAVIEARGEHEVNQAVTACLDEEWKPIPGSEEVVTVDTIVAGYGLIAATELTRLLECEHEYRPEMGGYIPRRNDEMLTTVPGVYAVGDGAGVGGIDMAVIEGKIAGISVVRETGYLDQRQAKDLLTALQFARKKELKFAEMLGALFTPGEGLYTLSRPETILCRCEQISHQDVLDAVHHGAQSITEVKNITRCGMGSCQGRVCEDLIARVIARHLEKTIPEAGSFRKRPPLHPLTISQLSVVDEEVN